MSDSSVAPFAEISKLRARVRALESLCAEMYQVAGTANAPVRVLDKLWAAAEGKADSTNRVASDQRGRVSGAPMTLPKRARRRQDRERMVAKALRIFRRALRGNYPSARRPHDYKALADNLAHCSKACCRNPRRTSKGIDRLPWQEVRARQRLGSDSFNAAIALTQRQAMSIQAFTGGDL